jgi:DNA-binding CsgD family transcriptional regulator
MRTELNVLIISSDLFLVQALTTLLNDFSNVDVIRGLPSVSLNNKGSERYYDAIFFDSRIDNSAEVIGYVISKNGFFPSDFIFISFLDTKTKGLDNVLYQFINLSMPVEFIKKNLFGVLLNMFQCKVSGRGGYNHSKILTQREKDVFNSTMMGDATKDIAFSLGINIKTMYSHRHNALRKLGFKNINEYKVFCKGSELHQVFMSMI